MNNETTTMWAAVDEGSSKTGTVYGVGATADEALADARRWSGSDDGAYDVVAISATAAAYVAKFGGEPCRELVVTRDGVVARSEVSQ